MNSIAKIVAITVAVVYMLLIVAALYNQGLQVLPWIIVTNIFTALGTCGTVVAVARAEKEAGRSLF